MCMLQLSDGILDRDPPPAGVSGETKPRPNRLFTSVVA